MYSFKLTLTGINLKSLISVIAKFKITKSIYKDLDERLEQSKYLAGEKYSIADIATWPWIARHEWHDIGLKNYKNLTRWYLEIAERKNVIKGYNFMDKEAKIPKP